MRATSIITTILSTILMGIIFTGCVDRKIKIYPVDGFAVAGRATYQKHTPTVSFLGITKKTSEAPIACAFVQVLDTSDSNKVIAEGSTNSDGVFNIGLPPELQNSPLMVRVLTVSALDKFPMMVIDQGTPAHTYHIDSPVFIGTKNDLDLHINDGLTSDLEGAFNVFAQIMRGHKFMTAFGGEAKTQFSALEVRWESGKVGIDCTCFFKQLFQPATINLRQDEDDDSVILHEFGHYLHNTFSNDSSPGGNHTISCNQNDDPRLTWSEGWATGFCLMVRKNSYYIDTDNQNFYVDHETPCHNGQGPVSETLVAAVYLDLYDGTANGMATQDGDTISIPFLLIWQAMKNVPNASRLTMYNYYLALLATGAITPQAWFDNFGALGFDETTLIANSSPSTTPTAAPRVPPQADPEFHTFLMPE